VPTEERLEGTPGFSPFLVYARENTMSSTAPNSSPVSRAVENTLSLFRDEGEVRRGEAEGLSPCHIFSYREDFDYLWGIGDHDNKSVVDDARALEQEASIVLVNDGLPDSSEQFAGPSLNVRDRITAYDWVVHFFLSVVDEGEVPSVRLFVLDVTSQPSDNSFAAQRLPSLLPLMPWVRIYRLFDDLTDLQSRLGHFRVGFGNLAADVMGGDVDPFSSVDEDTSDSAETLIREAWVNNLTRPEGRHDVSNLVAPLVLAEGLGRGEEIIQDNLRRAALAKLLETLGVLERQSDGEGQVKSPLETKMVENNIFGQFDHVRFLLLDDQAALGYHDVLASLLFGDNAVREEVERDGELESVSSDDSGSLQSITDPRPLVEALFEVTGLSGESEKEVEWAQPRVLDSLAAGEDEDDVEFDVLLLDLRLFGAESDSDQDEFLNRLAEFYEQSGAESLNDDQLERAVEAAGEYDAEEDDAAGLMHLALLPLLLSYVDPSLPIVLFSSTRQQAVTEALAHRPNIVTSFRKPVVSGYAEEMSPDDYLTSLSEAIVDALQIHEARCIWERLVDVEWTHMPIVEVYGRDKGVLKVYNFEGSIPPKEINGKTIPRQNGGKKIPRIRGKELRTVNIRAILSKYFIRYVYGQRYFDFISIPWEILNGSMIPKRILKRPWITRTGFGLAYDLDVRNNIASVLGHVRNKKAHGYIDYPDDGNTKRKFRISSMVIFMYFLDFIEGEESKLSLKEASEDMKKYMNYKYDHVSRQRINLKPSHMVVDTRADWLDVVAFTVSFEAEEAVDTKSGKNLISDKSIRSTRRLVNCLTEGCPHPDPVSTMGSDERVVGEVDFYNVDDNYGFIKNPKTHSGEDDIFLPANEKIKISPKGETLDDGSLVEFIVVRGNRGPVAKDVELLS